MTEDAIQVTFDRARRRAHSCSSHLRCGPQVSNEVCELLVVELQASTFVVVLTEPYSVLTVMVSNQMDGAARGGESIVCANIRTIPPGELCALIPEPVWWCWPVVYWLLPSHLQSSLKPPGGPFEWSIHPSPLRTLGFGL